MSPLRHLVLWAIGRRAAETQTTDAERQALVSCAQGRRRVVEIGVWHGVTTRLLRRAMAPDGVLWAVDPFPKGRLGFSMQRIVARSHVRQERHGRVRWVRTTGDRAAALYRQSGEPRPDMVFIDGDHTYDVARADWREWSELIAPGGVIALHDSRSTATRDIERAGSVRVTREMVLRDSRFEVVEEVDSLTVVRRRS